MNYYLKQKLVGKEEYKIRKCLDKNIRLEYFVNGSLTKFLFFNYNELINFISTVNNLLKIKQINYVEN